MAHEVLAFVRERGVVHPREVDAQFQHGKTRNWFGGSTNEATLPRHGHGPSLHHGWKAFFLCELTGGDARGSYETDAVGFFAPAELPPMTPPRSSTLWNSR